MVARGKLRGKVSPLGKDSGVLSSLGRVGTGSRKENRGRFRGERGERGVILGLGLALLERREAFFGKPLGW